MLSERFWLILVFFFFLNRKRLDPLEAYVPPVILAQLQFQDLGIFLYFHSHPIFNTKSNFYDDDWRENFERGQA